MTDTTVSLERVVGVPPERVWPYISDAALWARWQGERCTVDPVPGGHFEIVMPDGEVATGRVVEVIENERIVVTWGWESGLFGCHPGTSTVEISLVPHPPHGTRIVLVHRNLPDGAQHPHRAGWDHHLGILADTVDAEGAAGG